MPISLEGGTDVIRSIRHIHQSLSDDEVIVGVNDISQIANELFHDKTSENILVKPVINRLLRSLVDEECLAMISRADLFCIFGASIGETDSMWWEAIGKRLLHGKSRLIFFAYDNQPVNYNSQKIRKIEDYTSLIVSRCKLGEAASLEEIRRRIYIGYKTKLFVI